MTIPLIDAIHPAVLEARDGKIRFLADDAPVDRGS